MPLPPLARRALHAAASDPPFPATFRTARYNVFTFLPKFLFEQFNKVANIYFFIICVLTLMSFSPKDPSSFVSTFAFILSVSAVKEIIEDRQRSKADAELNGRRALVMRSTKGGDQTFTERSWADIRVGDLVKVSEGQAFPADLLFVSSSDSSGCCYVDTCNLDGETNLKSKMALPVMNCFRTPPPTDGQPGMDEIHEDLRPIVSRVALPV